MDKLKEVLKSEIEDFREKGHRFINGEMTMMEFKHASGGFGVYAHRGGTEFMIRLRIPSGVTDIYELEKVYNFAKKYNVSRIHFTTRQAIQFHGLKIDEVCDLMEEAMDYNIFTRGSGGNYPRNVALSPLAGVNTAEPFDPTPYALAVGNYFLERIYTYKLPRKLKVSFSCSNSDGAHCTVQDLGFLAVDNNGKGAFKVYIGGGLGLNPQKAVICPELINPQDVLYYVEAMVKLFMAEGNYENRAKARVRYILDRMGEEEFIKAYSSYVEKEKSKGGLEVVVNEKTINKKGKTVEINSNRIFEQKQCGLYSVYVHPIGGQLSIDDLNKLISLLKNYEDIDIRLAMTEGIYIRNLNGEEAISVLDATENMTGVTKLEHSIACVGAPICQIGLGNSQQLLRNIIEYFNKMGMKEDILPRINISGCGNSCGIHQVSSIGFTGKRKKVNGENRECFTVFIDGSYAVDRTRLGTQYGEMLKEDIPEFLYEIAQNIKEYNISFDEFAQCKKNEMEKIISKYVV